MTSGYKDVAYKLLTQTTYPSWGYMIEKGATTVWERWEEIVSEDRLLKQDGFLQSSNVWCCWCMLL